MISPIATIIWKSFLIQRPGNYLCKLLLVVNSLWEAPNDHSLWFQADVQFPSLQGGLDLVSQFQWIEFSKSDGMPTSEIR